MQKIEEQGQRAFTVFWNEKEIQEQKLRLHREIEEILAYRTKGAMLRSKVDWAEGGSKPTRYFLGLEKSKYNRKTITKLKDENGEICNTQKQIEKIQVKFYKNLYSDKNISQNDINLFFENLQGPKLTDKQRSDLELPITLGELSQAVKNMSNFKTPGPDGLCTELYKCFWSKLKIPLWDAMRESWKFGFDKQMLRSLITLIGKKDRDPLDIDNWRPISLLNVDYKIIAKTIANRLKKILPFIIDIDQKGFVPGRYIGENIMDLLGTIDYCDKQNIPSLLLSFHYRKAFDSVNLNYLDKALEFFGFGNTFRQYIRSLYEGIETSIINNGHVSPPVKVLSGLRQGCVLSPANFVIALAPLILKIKQSGNVQGIEISDELTKMFGLFADDIWATIMGPQQNLTNLLFTL